MPKVLPVRVKDRIPVIYPEWRWRLLSDLREKAARILEALASVVSEPVVIGSLARGDVSETSDIDVWLGNYVPTWKVTYALETAGINVKYFKVVQATPETALRALVVVEERVEISVPLSKLRKVEEEFPRFTGAVTLSDIRKGVRVRGVNKQLLFIEPRSYGHDEWSIIGFEEETARLLGVSLEAVLERVSMRLKRAREGKAGFAFYAELPTSEYPEEFVCSVARSNALVRRAVEKGPLGC